MRGAAWTITTGVASRTLGLVGTLVVTHYIARDALGEVSDAAIVALLANQVSTLGVGQYLIANPRAGRGAAWHATVLHIGLGVIVLGACVALQKPLGACMKAPTLGHYLPGLACAMMVDRIGFVPARLLARDMHFRAVSVARSAGELTYAIASVGLAILGWGGTAIVIANILRSALRTAIIVTSANRADWLTPARFCRETMRAMMRFGVPFSIGSSSGIASRRVDNLIVSSLFGASTVGAYNLAYNLADVPAVQIGEQIGDVLLPSFAYMAPEQRKSALVRSTGLLALVVFPLAVGLGAVSPSLVATLLKPEWRDVAPMLTILSVLSITRPLGWTISGYLQAQDRPRAVMLLETANLAGVVGLVFGLGHLGPLWACSAVGIAFGGHALASVWLVYRFDAVPPSRLFGRLAPPLLACLPIVVFVLGARAAAIAVGLRVGGLELAIEIAMGGIGYLLGARIFAYALSVDLVQLVLRAARRSRPPPIRLITGP